MESYHGLVLSPKDAIILLEASRQNLIPTIRRRLTERERIELIKNGAVFIWNEEESGMKRWTDGISWSASRVNGAFLMYKEMENSGLGNRDDSYQYKMNGLMKQSFSITLSTGVKLHLISYVSNEYLKEYYMNRHGMKSVLIRPTEDPIFTTVELDTSLYPYQDEHIDSTYATFVDRRIIHPLPQPSQVPRAPQNIPQPQQVLSHIPQSSLMHHHENQHGHAQQFSQLPSSLPQQLSHSQLQGHPAKYESSNTNTFYAPQMSYSLLAPSPPNYLGSTDRVGAANIISTATAANTSGSTPYPQRPGVYNNHSEDGRVLSYLDKSFI
ncbi:unnamed protein product [Kuraishia capsulata CBS 1993]|uniref:cAMP-independent regulatory protein pac2 n=1 Tax=Kuraishia capsulata CBS 1993 TaxID=1382522 RepID=W6MWA3_9ASCO|nr:uncharacterized protein KUCA_T00003072001 [Kuraishia capsulata CBS 1993]CDK27095.1 unnamed protein product [Kuraishia capsulata CBS 1993]